MEILIADILPNANGRKQYIHSIAPVVCMLKQIACLSKLLKNQLSSMIVLSDRNYENINK